MSDNRVSSPYSTGGGGTNFEHDVGSLYLAALLTQKIPAGVQDGKVKKIQFQALHTGSLVDDIIITLDDDKRQKIIAYQIKHRLTFSQSDNTFKDIMEDCWKTFAGQTRFSFDPEKDMLGIGIGIYSQNLDEHLQTLLEWARTSLTSKEFLSKVEMRGFSSDEKRNLSKIIRNSLKFAKGDTITDDEFWRFLRCLTIYYFDIKENGRDRKYCINSLLEIVEDEDVSKAKALFNTLHSIVGKYAQSGGSIDRESLVEEVRSYVVDKKDRKKEQEFNPKVKKILNENVFKLLATVSVKKDSIYSINLKVGDRRFANKLPYIRHAEKFLTIYHPNIGTQLQKIKELVNQYNQNASGIIVTLQNSIREKMGDHYPGLTEDDHFHIVSSNSYSMPSLLELTWNYCEQREQSEIVQFFSSNFTKMPHSLYGWALSRELRGFVITADYIITSSMQQFAEPHILISILKSICHIEDMTQHFNTLRSVSEEIDSLIEEFSYNMKDLSEEIDLETAD